MRAEGAHLRGRGDAAQVVHVGHVRRVGALVVQLHRVDAEAERLCEGRGGSTSKASKVWAWARAGGGSGGGGGSEGRKLRARARAGSCAAG